MKKLVGKHGHKRDDNIKMDVTEKARGNLLWIDLAVGKDQWRAAVNTVMKLPVAAGCYLSHVDSLRAMDRICSV
jgi:hypothetical protein